MKLLLPVFLFLITITTVVAQKKKIVDKNANAETIHWITLEEAQEKMKKDPKKVYIDVYTNWCIWCRKLESTTFVNPQVIDYINTNYYAIRLDAETEDTLFFKGKGYARISGSNTNALVAEWMRSEFTYPTSIFFDEYFKNPQPVPGYLNIPNMEMILKYIATNQHRSIPFDKYKNEFKGNW